jgi:hypothetical protein
VRRWLQRQKDAFFSLSAPEQELATPGQVMPPLSGSESPDTSNLSTAGLPKGFFKPFFLVKDVDPDGPAAIAVTILYFMDLVPRPKLLQGLRDDDLIVTFGETPVRSLAPLTYQAIIRSAVNENVRAAVQSDRTFLDAQNYRV